MPYQMFNENVITSTVNKLANGRSAETGDIVNTLLNRLGMDTRNKTYRRRTEADILLCRESGKIERVGGTCYRKVIQNDLQPLAKASTQKETDKGTPTVGDDFDGKKPAGKAPAKTRKSHRLTTRERNDRRQIGRAEKAHIGRFPSACYKVLKQVHPDLGISNKAMSIMNSFVNDIFERIAGEASKLASYNKHFATISSREIQTAPPRPSWRVGTRCRWGGHQGPYEISRLRLGHQQAASVL
ncbi:hypothetical protein HDV00_002711 [Rhizophlyctis rosea]|nr:hypothetical protein HDV00_002711 [Rhizophlyctis rosea]